MDEIAVIILAAGKGTRMKSSLTKVLHTLCDRAMIQFPVETAQGLNPQYLGVVVGHQASRVKEELQDHQNISFVEQKEQLGTGHAVLQCWEDLQSFSGVVLILNGDVPLLKKSTLERLLTAMEEGSYQGAILTACLDNPQGYGRILRNEKGNIHCVIEDKDLPLKHQGIQEINTGIYAFKAPQLFSVLSRLNTDNAQGEYYLTDVARLWSEDGYGICPVVVENTEELLGINDRRDLARVEGILRAELLQNHMQEGVTIEDPQNTYIGYEVQIEPDVILRPGTILQGQTRIETGAEIGPDTTIASSTVGRYSRVFRSHVTGADIGPDCSVGPYAHIRPETRLDRGVKVGDFVEIKKSRIGTGSKVPHLSYVGDTTMGEKCNIGAGTITANYDGIHKNPTAMGNHVFIGSNTTLVAPLRLGDGSRTGAGAVVTKDVADSTTVIGVPARPLKKKKKEE